MGKQYHSLHVRKQTFALVSHECVEEFRRHHPELDHIPISQDKIIYELARFYLETK